eukprot:TRINITY_DN100550_c0_g1_i1.p1 TRINITY_DN100550_c0_g1~~TRINITY_DN100550_c0_g1_i1.p1  ORF type:complete len:306 (+),score=52.74 TRINITY_DN100550_c0_g1_i1:54-920(+)
MAFMAPIRGFSPERPDIGASEITSPTSKTQKQQIASGAWLWPWHLLHSHPFREPCVEEDQAWMGLPSSEEVLEAALLQESASPQSVAPEESGFDDHAIGMWPWRLVSSPSHLQEPALEDSVGCGLAAESMLSEKAKHHQQSSENASRSLRRCPEQSSGHKQGQQKLFTSSAAVAPVQCARISLEREVAARRAEHLRSVVQHLHQASHRRSHELEKRSAQARQQFEKALAKTEAWKRHQQEETGQQTEQLRLQVSEHLKQAAKKRAAVLASRRTDVGKHLQAWKRKVEA